MVPNKWRVEALNPTVEREIRSLPKDVTAQYVRIGRMITEHGLGSVNRKYLRHITGPLWEIRLRGRDQIARALYVTARPRRVVVVRVFAKTTQKTPRREIELALRRAQEVLN